MKEHYQGLAHIAIYTKDMKSHIAFYEKIGGSKIDEAQVENPHGTRYLALVEFAGFVLELIQPTTEFHAGEGAIPHMAILVDDVTVTGTELQALGVDTFRTEKPNINMKVFGGVENWFFEGPSGEVIEIMKKI